MPPPIRPPELSELETLAVCAAEGSLAAAAGVLGISRPAVAKRVTTLEAIVGTALLERDTRGVRLTEQGAAVVAHARRLLAERDALMDAITEVRANGDGPRISGVREMLGRSTPSARAAQRPEALLAETEQLFEIVFHASATGVVISDPDTGLAQEANDAFCRFVDRPRTEVVGRPAMDVGAWDSLEERRRLVEAVRRRGVVREVPIRVRLPDGSLRHGHVTSQLIQLGGRPWLLSTVNETTTPSAA